MAVLPQDVQAQMQQLELPLLERAEAHLTLAQAVHALTQLYLKCANAAYLTEAVQKETERLQQYSRRMKKAGVAQNLAESRPTVGLNIAAANRFISAAIPDLTEEQRAMLKKVEQQHKQAAGAADASGAQRSKKHRQSLSGAQLKEDVAAFLDAALAQSTPEAAAGVLPPEL